MVHYKNLINHMKATVKDIDKWHNLIEALEEAVEHFHKHKREDFLELKAEIHELVHGEKFDEHFAKIEVSEMFHNCPEKGKVEGEKISIIQTQEYMKKYGIQNECEWDAYVAFNANYHDKKSLFKRWHPEDWEEKIIEDAVHYYFKDADAPKGKVWKVFSSY